MLAEWVPSGQHRSVHSTATCIISSHSHNLMTEPPPSSPSLTALLASTLPVLQVLLPHSSPRSFKNTISPFSYLDLHWFPTVLRGKSKLPSTAGEALAWPPPPPSFLPQASLLGVGHASFCLSLETSPSASAPAPP